ncbi:MAG TPA: hypothetical protein VJB60_00125 [Candidatus Peribacterales bacterium]|nr:hypothetical protein [Candidatus Peribacterales bacterium]
MDTPPTGSSWKAHAEKQMNALETWMAPLFGKAPHLPENIRQGLATIAPWAALIFGIIGILGIFSIFNMLSMFSAIPHNVVIPGIRTMYPVAIVTLVIGGIASVLQVLAFKPLQARRKKGWNFLFYANTLSTTTVIINLLLSYGGAIGGVIGILIGYWLLFEIRGIYRE